MSDSQEARTMIPHIESPHVESPTTNPPQVIPTKQISPLPPRLRSAKERARLGAQALPCGIICA